MTEQEGKKWSYDFSTAEICLLLTGDYSDVESVIEGICQQMHALTGIEDADELKDYFSRLWLKEEGEEDEDED